MNLQNTSKNVKFPIVEAYWHLGDSGASQILRKSVKNRLKSQLSGTLNCVEFLPMHNYGSYMAQTEHNMLKHTANIGLHDVYQSWLQNDFFTQF